MATFCKSPVQLGLLGAILAVGVTGWVMAPVSYIADDSFFYLVISRHLAISGQQTFSGIYPTNGVHPLWQYLLAAYTFLIREISPDTIYQVGYAVPLSAAFVAFGAVLFWRTALRLGLEPLILVGPPLVYVLTFGILYSEGPVLYATLGLLAYLTVRLDLEDAHTPYWLGIAGALVFFARLDSIFFLWCYGLWLWLQWGRFRPALIFGIMFVAVTSPYLAANFYWFGALAPVSGWLKSTFPHVAEHTPALRWAGISTTLWGYEFIWGAIPLLGTVLLWARLRRRFPSSHSLLTALVGGSLLHCLYIVLFTDGATAWYWYYILPQVTFAWALALAWKESAEKAGLFARRAGALSENRLVIVVLLLIFIAITIYRINEPEGNADKYRLSVEYLNKRNISDQTILVSDAPGYMAFFTKNRIIAADMLTANRRMFQRLLDSKNGLAFLQTEASRSGHPIGLVMYNDGGWIHPSPDLTRIDMLSNKAGASGQIIGSWTLPNGPSEIVRKNGALFFAVWEVPPETPPNQSPGADSSPKRPAEPARDGIGTAAQPKS